MNSAGEKFFSGAGLTHQEHCGAAAGGGAMCEIDDVSKRRTVADDVRCPGLSEPLDFRLKVWSTNRHTLKTIIRQSRNS